MLILLDINFLIIAVIIYLDVIASFHWYTNGFTVTHTFNLNQVGNKS